MIDGSVTGWLARSQMLALVLEAVKVRQTWVKISWIGDLSAI